MALKDKILKDLSVATKEKKEVELLVLRQILSATLNQEKEKRFKLSKEKPDMAGEDLDKESRLAEEEVQSIIFTEAKKRKEAMVDYEKGGRQDLVDKEKAELAILEDYLPEQMSGEELKNLAKEAIDKIGAKSMQDIGKVMSDLMPKVKGKADGGQVNQVVKSLLENAGD